MSAEATWGLGDRQLRNHLQGLPQLPHREYLLSDQKAKTLIKIFGNLPRDSSEEPTLIKTQISG